MASKGTKTPLKFNSWTLGGHGAEIFEKSAEALNLERLNPLRGVNEWRLGQIFDDARDGIYADLAWLYAEIEAVEPALASCCDMRESAASECGWIVKTADADRTRGFDQKLADEQRTSLLSEFGAVEDDLAELAGHLVSAFFRGAAHAQPLWNEDGTLAGFRHLDLWNFAFDRQTGLWYWNADASRDEETFQPVPPGEIVSLAVSSRRHVDHAALPIFIRAALGAKRYGVWLDRFGIPPVGIIMPPNAEKGEQSSYMDLARKFARGGSGILPNGSSITYGTEARAVCPFQDFIRFQQEQVFMLGIGRIQSGANDAASLGGNAAGVVENGFRRIVRRDARQIARAINDCVTRKVLDRLFPGRPALAQFAWDTETKRTSREALEDAGLAKAAGLAIDIGQLEEMTGYTLKEVPDPASNGVPTPFGGGLRALNGRHDAPTPFKTRDFQFKNAPRNSDGRGEVKNAEGVEVPSRASGEAVLEAAAKDTGPAADAIRELMEDPTPEKAKALMARLPELLPEDPALATVFADAMAEAYVGAAEGLGVHSVATNSGTSEGARKGWETRRRNGWTPEQLAENKAKVDGLIADLSLTGPDGKGKAWKNEPKDLGEISESLAADISAANPRMKATAGTMQTIDHAQLKHALDEHGVGRETRPNSLPITTEDLKKIPDVLSDYDEIRPGKGIGDGKKQEAVIFRKKYDDGTVCCVEIDWFSRGKKRNELKFQTMWKEKLEEKK